MKIVSVHIQSFGKLQNFDSNFQSGINVLAQCNGFGKTTLCNFIRAMLYGFKYTRSKRGGESISDVGTWTTWNSSKKIGGSIVVEHQGKTYRIERYFGSTAKTETLSVINELDGRTVDVGQPGEYFLGLTAESFDRSAYLPQESVEISSNENFDTRLAGLVQNAEDFDKVERDLQEYVNNLTSTRRANSQLTVAENDKRQLQRDIYQREVAEARQKAIDSELKSVEAERETQEKKIQFYNSQIAQLQKRLGQMQPSAEQLTAQEKLSDLRQKLSRAGELEVDKAKCDQLAEKIQNTPELAQKQRKISKPLLATALGLLLVGVGLCFWQWIVGIAIVSVGIATGTLSFFLHPPLTTLPSGEREFLINEYYKIAAKYVFCDGDYAQVQKALWQKYNEYECDKREYAALSQIVVQQPDTSSTVRTELAYANKYLSDAQTQLLNLAAKRGSLQEERKNLKVDSIQLREKLQETQNDIENIRHKAFVAEKTLELLRQAKENLSLSYLPTLKDSFTQLLQQVTEQPFQLVLDRDFNLKLRQDGVTKGLDFYSRGVREITLLCFRVAISQLLFNGQVPLLLVDDAFVNFDEQNFLRATKLLKNLAQNTQIIYLTCHDRLGELKAS